MGKIHQPDLVGARFSLADAEFDIHAFGEQVVEGFVVTYDGQRRDTQSFLKVIPARFNGNVRIDTFNRGAQAGLQDDLAINALWVWAFRQVGTIQDAIAILIA